MMIKTLFFDEQDRKNESPFPAKLTAHLLKNRNINSEYTLFYLLRASDLPKN